jgi:hypothetical protein
MDELNDERLFKESDIILVPLCLMVLYAFAYIARKKYRNTGIEQYFLPALNLRFLFAVIYALIVEFYYGYGDTIMYYNAVQDMHRAVSDDFSYLKEILLIEKLGVTDEVYPYFRYDGAGYTDMYMSNVHNYSVAKFALPFSLMFSKSFLCISFCFSFFSFAGCWRIFKMFYEIYPPLKKKLAIATLFLPSILFWGSSFLKDSICLGAMGFMIYALYSIFIKKKKVFVSVMILLAATVLIYYIKPYIVLSLMLAVIAAFFMALNRKIKSRELRLASSVFFIGLAAIAGFFMLSTFAAFEISSQFATENILKTMQGVQTGYETVEGGGSFFKVGNVENSMTGLLLLFPAGIGTSLFRPFLWEVNNPLMLLNALESLGFLVLTLMILRRIGFFKAGKLIFSDSILIFCFTFVILFAGFVGITTFNFGSLSRYKIPCLPFYLIMLFIVMHKSGKFSPNYVFSKKFF